MKNVLVIGSTVVDVIIQIDHLPSAQEDVHVQHQHMSLGGCAYNVSDMIRHFGVPYTHLFTGRYRCLRKTLSAHSSPGEGVATPIPAPAQENGCCYCFIEADGERTFLSYHGAEYRFEREWFQIPDATDIDAVYICGLEIEEPAGVHIVEYLEAHPEFQIYFGPGPRISKIDPKLMSRIYALHPVMHLNENEALSFTKEDGIDAAANAVFSRTQNDVIITLGAKGAYYRTALFLRLCTGDRRHTDRHDRRRGLPHRCSDCL
ncbi:MAG: PfkB family carbohydrate kinase [Lachnospiraceae bacterium]